MEWDELVEIVNAQPGYQLLQIGFEPATGQAFMQYRRSGVQKLVYHENLLSIFQTWDAIYHVFANRWIWLHEPQQDGGPVNAIDGNVEKTHPYRYETGVFWIGQTVWSGVMTFSNGDPAASAMLGARVCVKHQNPEHHYIEGGMWLIPPNLRHHEFDLSKVVSAEDLRM